jgi:3-oxoacyl-[acyl-carrier protein] reductase
MTDLNNKLAIVTGAGRGSGRAVALALGQARARVVVVDVNPDAAQRTADEIAAAGGAAQVQVVDVSNKMGVQTMIYEILDMSPRISILVNAAGITPHNTALKMDEGEWNRTLDVNLKGVFLTSQTAARAMQQTGGGVILNVLRPAGAAPHAAVRAAREGLLGLTAVLAEEWRAFGVRVELVSAPDYAALASEVLRRCPSD